MKQRRESTRVDAAPHVSVAPGLLDKLHTVVREPGESDERYRARCELFAAVLDYARKD
jgi:hypothetical protein